MSSVPFLQWCRKNGLWCSKTDAPTHTTMDGGKLSIPFEKLELFYNRCIEAVISGEYIYIVELKTPIYNMFMDVDYMDKYGLDDDKYIDIITTICKTVSEKSCIISLANHKKKKDLIKSGIHFNWQFPVDKTAALSLRDKVIDVLSDKYPDDDWDKFIDTAV